MTGEVQKILLRNDIVKLLSERTGLSEDKIRNMNNVQLAKLLSSNDIPVVEPSQLPDDNSIERFKSAKPKESWLKRTWNKIPKGVKIGAGVAVGLAGGWFLGGIKLGLGIAGVVGAGAILQSCTPEKPLIPFDVPENYKSFFACYCNDKPMYEQLQRCIENGGNVSELKRIFNDNDLQLDSIIKRKNELKDMIHKIEAKASGQLNNEQQQLLAQMLATTVLIDEKDSEAIDKLREFLEMVYNKFDNLNQEDTGTYNSILKSITRRCDSSFGAPAVSASVIGKLMNLANTNDNSAYMAYMARNPYNINMLDLFLSVPNHNNEWQTVFNGLIASTASMELGPQTSMDLILSDTVNLPENMQLSIYKMLSGTAPEDLYSLTTFLRLACKRTLNEPQMQLAMDEILSQPMPSDVNPILANIDHSGWNNKEKTTAHGILLAQVSNNRNSFDHDTLQYTLREIAIKVYEDVQNCGVQTFPYSDVEYMSAQDLYAKLQPIINGSAPYDKSTIDDIFLCLSSVLAVSVN